MKTMGDAVMDIVKDKSFSGSTHEVLRYFNLHNEPWSGDLNAIANMFSAAISIIRHKEASDG